MTLGGSVITSVEKCLGKRTIYRNEGLSQLRFEEHIIDLQFVARFPAGALRALRACRSRIQAALEIKEIKGLMSTFIDVAAFSRDDMLLKRVNKTVWHN